jgi:hypothetical protein
VPQIEHLFLKRENYLVELLDLLDLLHHDLRLVFEGLLVLVERRVGPVLRLDLLLQNVVVLLDGAVLLGGLVLEDLQLVLKDLDPLLELGQVLRAVLDEVDLG